MEWLLESGQGRVIYDAIELDAFNRMMPVIREKWPAGKWEKKKNNQFGKRNLRKGHSGRFSTAHLNVADSVNK